MARPTTTTTTTDAPTPTLAKLVELANRAALHVGNGEAPEWRPMTTHGEAWGWLLQTGAGCRYFAARVPRAREGVDFEVAGTNTPDPDRALAKALAYMA